jgi:hypothetical protein
MALPLFAVPRGLGHDVVWKMSWWMARWILGFISFVTRHCFHPRKTLLMEF